MDVFPKTLKTRRARILRYEQELRRERRQFGTDDDSYRKRYLLSQPQPQLDIWHGSNWAAKEYADAAPREILGLWDLAALQWARETYANPELSRVRSRYVEIFKQLKTEPPGPKRTELVSEAGRLWEGR
jgi:hypothetical protein